MRRASFVCLFLAGLAVALGTAGCGGSTAVTGPEEAAPSGSAVLNGGVVGAGFGASSTGAVRALSGESGMRVSVVSTSLSTDVDDDGRFVLVGLPSGSITLRFEGAGVDTTLAVSGLVDGQVLTIEVQLSGGAAHMGSAPSCAPSAETFYSGLLESISGTQLVVGGRTVDASEVKKVWRGEHRVELGDLQVGDKVKVWGVLRGDGVLVAVEIQALTTEPGPGSWVWVSFTGTIESVEFKALDAAGVHPSCEDGYPVLVVKGTTVVTGADTKFRRTDGSALDPATLKVGQQAHVEGWKKTDGTVKAATLTV